MKFDPSGTVLGHKKIDWEGNDDVYYENGVYLSSKLFLFGSTISYKNLDLTLTNWNPRQAFITSYDSNLEAVGKDYVEALNFPTDFSKETSGNIGYT